MGIVINCPRSIVMGEPGSTSCLLPAHAYNPHPASAVHLVNVLANLLIFRLKKFLKETKLYFSKWIFIMVM